MENDKDFMEKVADVATDVADSIVKTTSDLYQKGKAQVETARLKSDIREQHKKLGAICYALEKGYSSDCSRKDEIIAKLDALNEKLEDIENERAAEKAARDAEKNAQREAREASKTTEAKKSAPIEIKFTSEKCSECGEARIGTLMYCGYCGAKFGEQ